MRSGPLFLLSGYVLWCSVIYCVNEGQGIMVSRIARESAFTRFATSYVDEAFGFATGVNYFIQTCSLLCFEVTALHGVIGFWYDVSLASALETCSGHELILISQSCIPRSCLASVSWSTFRCTSGLPDGSPNPNSGSFWVRLGRSRGANLPLDEN